MKNKKGFILPLLIIIIALAGGTYFYLSSQKKYSDSSTKVKVEDNTTKQTIDNSSPSAKKFDHPLFSISYPSTLNANDSVSSPDTETVRFNRDEKTNSGFAVTIYSKNLRSTETEIARHESTFKEAVIKTNVVIDGKTYTRIDINQPSVHSGRVFIDGGSHTYILSYSGADISQTEFAKFYSSFKLK